MNDFLNFINDKLESVLTIDIDFLAYNGSSREFLTYDYEVFDKTFDRIQGQLIIETNTLSKTTLVDRVDKIRKVLDNQTYSTTNSGANFDFVTVNDLSRMETFDYAKQIIFEFKLYLKEVTGE